MTSIEALITALRDLSPGGQLEMQYGLIVAVFPDGTGLDAAKHEISRLANECGCDMDDRPQYLNIMFQKRPYKLGSYQTGARLDRS
jgi:hypothetical protein